MHIVYVAVNCNQRSKIVLFVIGDLFSYTLQNFIFLLHCICLHRTNQCNESLLLVEWSHFLLKLVSDDVVSDSNIIADEQGVAIPLLVRIRPPLLDCTWRPSLFCPWEKFLYWRRVILMAKGWEGSIGYRMDIGTLNRMLGKRNLSLLLFISVNSGFDFFPPSPFVHWTQAVMTHMRGMKTPIFI